LAQRVGIDSEAAVEFLDALREEVEQLRELGLAPGDDDAPQRNALFSLSKKPSSLLYVFSSVCVSNSSSRRRCSSFRCRGTSTLTSPARAPTPLACPSPLSRIRCPSCIPAGMSTATVRCSNTRPAPWHSVHGVSILRPEPPQVGHAWVRTNSPKTLRLTCCIRPAPPHVGHVVTGVPGSAPSPSQCGHVTAIWNGTSRVVPRAASTSSISTVAARS